MRRGGGEISNADIELTWICFSYSDPPIRTTLVVPGRVRSAVFASLPPPPPIVAFLAPIADTHDIAKQVVSALETEQSRNLVFPRVVGWSWIAHGLPTWAVDSLVWVRPFS